MFRQSLGRVVRTFTLVFAIGLVAGALCCGDVSAQPQAPSTPTGVGGSSSGRRDSNTSSRSLIPVGAPRVASVQHIDAINSPDRDNNPIVSADGSVMFFNSTRRGTRSWARYNEFEHRHDEDIYVAVRSIMRHGAEDWDTPFNIGPPINSSRDDGVVSISPDGQTLYYNSLKDGWEKDGGPFYSAQLKGQEWAHVTGLGGGIAEFFRTYQRGTSFRIYGGSISSDANDFYFATTLYSPTGKHQIWVSHRRADGWGYPENLGSTVNDGHGSYAPCIAADGRTLFYTSCGPNGFGGDDIVMARLEGTRWTVPINIGQPINTPDNDSFLSLPASGDRVYFSVTTNGNEDIYVAPLPTLLRPNTVVLVSGRVFDGESGVPIEATVTIEDLEQGRTIFKSTSNAMDGKYTAVLQAGRNYGISISAPDHVFLSEHYQIAPDAAYGEYRQDFPLEKLRRGTSFVVNNIFFDYDEATLTSASKPELERIVALMQEQPALVLEITGHTDNVGSAGYNMKLSLERAEAVRDYLLQNGNIAAARLRVRGLGYTRPIASNRTEQGRHQNRRSEFTVIAL